MSRSVNVPLISGKNNAELTRRRGVRGQDVGRGSV